ncbi:MAG: right-handed parallel beta-helix repeat-containing protein [Nocardioidaceae bacterium]|nr:right-handed parallel beta-helix repeat-containing protein [Nocardioidaceae bacterium]
MAIAVTTATIAATIAPTMATANAQPPSTTTSSVKTSSATVLYAKPKSTSAKCTKKSPCTLQRALKKSKSGTVIKLRTGKYGKVTLKGPQRLRNAKKNVRIIPATKRSKPTFARIDSHVPHVTWKGITVKGTWYLRAEANRSTIEDSHINGGGLFLRADDVTVQRSLFENGSSLDGIQIGGANRVLVANNTIRNYDQNRNNGLHADCIQIFESNDITLRANRVSNCYNAGLIISVGGGDGMRNLLIESNYIQGCIVVKPDCRGGSAADLREQSTDGITVRNNTFANGSLRVVPMKGLTFDRNIVTYLSACDSPITNTIVAKWNVNMCKMPPILTTAGNKAASITFTNQEAGNLTPTPPGQATITP